MADSTLDLTGEESPTTLRGHGTGALGPSDTSDSGSDVVGGPGMDEGLSDDQSREMPMKTRATAGRDLGDDDLSSDSDSSGTGERASSGVDDAPANDLSTTVHPGIDSGADELDDPDAVDIERVDGNLENVVAGDEDLDDVPGLRRRDLNRSAAARYLGRGFERPSSPRRLRPAR